MLVALQDDHHVLPSQVRRGSLASLRVRWTAGNAYIMSYEVANAAFRINIFSSSCFQSVDHYIINMKFLIFAVALVAAQGGFIYGFDSGTNYVAHHTVGLHLRHQEMVGRLTQSKLQASLRRPSGMTPSSDSCTAPAWPTPPTRAPSSLFTTLARLLEA